MRAVPTCRLCRPSAGCAQPFRSASDMAVLTGARRQATILKRLRRLSDWPLIVKFGVAPALSLGLLLIITAIEVDALYNIRNDTQHIVSVDMRDVTRLADIAARFERADADLYRSMNMEAANPGMVDIPVRAAAIQRALVQIRSEELTSELSH